MGAARTDAHAPPGRLRSWLGQDARHDIPASLVVFLVAVPLSLGIAAASGAPVMAGLIAAVVGGIVAGALGGSALQVSGPAAGLTVVVAELITQFGWAVTCSITVIAGALQLLLGACRIGRAALAISPTVVHAMLAGIGVTIVLGQLHVLLGGAAGTSAWENISELPGQLLDLHSPAAFIGLGVIVLLVAWPRLPARVRAVPGPLVAIVAATAISSLAALTLNRVELPDSPFAAIALPQLPNGQWGAFALGVFTLTVIASVESLLSAVSVDKLREGHRSNLDRELIGQGSANVASGLLGGLPVTGVIVRSSTNVRAGARTRASAVLHGIWVLLFTVLLVGLVEQVPMAALAGLLVFIGTQLVRPDDIRSARSHGELHVYLITVAGVVMLNLLEGVLIGLAVAMFGMLRRVVWARVRVEDGDGPDEEGRETRSVVVEGTLSFLSVPRLSRVLAQVPDGSAVTVELVVDYLDHAAYGHLATWKTTHVAGGGTVVVDEIGGPGPNARRKRPGVVGTRTFLAWSQWQAGEPEIPAQTRRDPLVVGAREYHRRGASVIRPQLRKLASSQAPHALFLTCADSRIVPNVITASGPGDLFTIRNVGNLVPRPNESDDQSVQAAVEYAVGNLGVRTIVVCGHSRCGAMTATLADQAGDGAVAQWLRWAEPSVREWRAGHPLGRAAEEDGWSEVDQLAMVNVAVQLDTLRSMPEVRDADVRLVGMFFDIPTGTVLSLEDDRFTPMPGDRAALPPQRTAAKAADGVAGGEPAVDAAKAATNGSPVTT
ncbi:SulP family inorganic anion transporter [Actinokineospora spheciospongiae]|uniref:SulP family inorganic anion transporter n=1 Tax=Actinokineospora spheciospongiae TaxID=909613 RepID=UPI000D71BA43|nr:bifunctional SulP family inorganic anion transporter/carbonic anhydrase [Actinokineospora spheciospongiae]PWW62517.1 carbonic anhydrase [Actinokineospora spheciospongiae]